MNTKENPYVYVSWLIEKAKTHVEKGAFYTAYLECFTEYNHGHSGFTEGEEELFSNPKNSKEQEFSNTIAQLHVVVIRGLLHELKNNMDSLEHDQISFRIGAIRDCFSRLEDPHPYPPELFQQFKEVYTTSCRMGAIHSYTQDFMDNWIALKELPNYKELREIQHLFLNEHSRQGMDSVRLWHRDQFFNCKPEEFYINDPVLAHMKATLTGDAFLLVDFLHNKEVGQPEFSTPIEYHGIQAYTIYKSDWRPQPKL